MLKSHERFYSQDGKRLVLIVDDEIVNREMLKMILSEEYEIIQAANGEEALELIRENASLLSLVILDLMMPKMSGQELLDIMRGDEKLRRIPVIVLTSDKTAEIDCLQHGASDFIMKPFDMPEVVQARIRRTIELSEDTYIIQNTERDELTGLLNKEFFYRYSELFKLHHPSRQMDAMVMDVNNFHLVNEIQGRAFGDLVLRKIGERIIKHISATGGVGGRGYADMFLLYLPTGTDYEEFREEIMSELTGNLSSPRVHVRLGVYKEADKSLPMEECFDRAKTASDQIRGNYSQPISIYDDELHEQDLQNQMLINEMHQALEEKQFHVYYQPKYEITGEKPVLKSAEALIRWKHPELGMISPGVFIPLFEKNGLIQELDRYVWKEAAEQMRRWKEEFGIVLPISVNVSRIDMYAPDFVSYLLNLMWENDIQPEDYFLEITESAYTENSSQLIRIVEQLRNYGFKIEMDDFGSGYSSLNMLAEMPIDVLKLDMRFVRNLYNTEKNTRMVELMLDIAHRLDVITIAEGVETEEQMLDLKRMGCERVQGYYFSGPVPPEKFEGFIREVIEC
jgi:EAL domain-containing protein (putative c-di-GMP-specific phosphodiesterase class I)/CheY-like chemotaxis protein